MCSIQTDYEYARMYADSMETKLRLVKRIRVQVDINGLTWACFPAINTLLDNAGISCTTEPGSTPEDIIITFQKALQ